MTALTQADIGRQATALQDTASDPQKNVWVGASAGTGKTKVLTERVLRLLLPAAGHVATEPDKILCITYTKAGASEMIGRIMGILSDWAVCDGDKLNEKLTKLLGEAPSIHQIDRARRLFALVIDTPGGLKVTTIHAFCQSVLGRFPIEAGLSPQFQVIEEGEAAALVKQARDGLIADIRAGRTDDGLAQAFYRLSQWKNGDQINKIIKSVLSEREELQHYRQISQGLEPAIRHIYDRLGVTYGQTQEDIIGTYMSPDNFPLDTIKELAKAFEYGSPTNQTTSVELYNFCAATPAERTDRFQAYCKIYLTDKGELRNSDRAVSKGARAFNPAALDIFMDEGTRILRCLDALKSLTIAVATESLLRVGYDLIDRYTALKNQRNALDYDDLIYRTRDLLTHQTVNGRDMTDWVLYKLDGGIDHVLVDEAQDTSPAQWEIILQIINEFFDGHSARDNAHRTIFVVGDDKQSIFSFQGADPANFETVRQRIAQKITDGGMAWEEVPMATSFRSVDAVLVLTDAVFAPEDIRRYIVQNPAHIVKHTAFLQGHAGRIDIWPLYKTPKKDAPQPWEMPVEVKQAYDAQAALAARIAAQIKKWIDNGEILPSKNRPINAGDVMILVRRRNALVEHLVRAMKDLNIPVSGVDRMVITDQIAVQDMLAVLNFALMPDDDLSLACVLKSPFIGWDDDTLFAYAHGRTSSLWQAVKDRAPEGVTDWLRARLENAAGVSAFDAVSAVLNHITPNNGKNGWQAVLSRLGQDALDPLQELLNLCLNYDRQNPAKGVQGFLHKMQGDSRDIKRELDDAQNQVRIMTVHASKGLESPIVILPDTTAIAKSHTSEDGLIWAGEDFPLWSPSAADENEAYSTLREKLKDNDYAEYCRLLYVALTRAEDRIIVCGTIHTNEVNEKSWYGLFKNGFNRLDETLRRETAWAYDEDYMTGDESMCLTYETPQIAPPRADKHINNHWAYNGSDALPVWATQMPAVEQHPPRHLAPSKSNEADVPVRSPLAHTSDTYKFARGLLTHSLLQYLPDLPAAARAQAATAYLERHGGDVSADIHADIIGEVMAILENPQFAPFFAEGSQSEVPVTGKVENPETGRVDIISGQIDRLLVTDDTVWIVDYKSNRPSPKDASDVPVIYKNQLRAYKTLIGRIYKNRDIRCALLWTDTPAIMEIKDV